MRIESGPDPSTSSRSGYGLMLLAVAFFGVNCLLVKAVGTMPEGNVFAVNAWRCLTGVVLTAVIGLRAGSYRPHRVLLRPLLILRGVIGGSALLLFYITLFHLEIGRATTVNSSYVLWSTLFAAAFLGERFGLLQFTGILVALVGMGILTGAFEGFAGAGWMDLLAIAGAVMAGVAVVLIRLLRRTEDSITIYLAQAFWGLVVCLPFLTLDDLFPSGGLLPVLVLGGLLAGIGQLALTSAFRYLSVAKGASMQLLIPVINTIGGILLFGEVYDLSELGGGLLVLAGCLTVVRSRPPVVLSSTPRLSESVDRDTSRSFSKV